MKVEIISKFDPDARDALAAKLGTVVQKLSFESPRPEQDQTTVWHSDFSFMKYPIELCMLCCDELPMGPGSVTEFADMKKVFNLKTPQEVAELILGGDTHSLHRLRKMGSRFPHMNDLPDMQQFHPRVIEVDGTYVYYDNPGFGGDATPIPSQCIQHHTWRVGDVVVWDNRTTMHRHLNPGYTGSRRMTRYAISLSHGVKLNRQREDVLRLAGVDPLPLLVHEEGCAFRASMGRTSCDCRAGS